MFEMHYPDETPTPTFSVTLPNPDAPGSSYRPDEGIIGDELGAGLIVRTTKVGDLVQRPRYLFRGLTFAHRTAVEAFKAGVGGRSFRYREDPTCGWHTSYQWAQFDLEGGYALEWRWGVGGWSVELPLRTVAAPS